MKTKIIRAGGCLLALIVLIAAVGCNTIARGILDSVGEEVGETLTDEQADKLAFGAVLSTRNSMHNRTMFGMSSVYLEVMEEVVYESWDINDRESALESLDWLRDEGHRLPYSEDYYGYDEIYHIIAGKQAPDEDELEMLAVELAGYKDICRGLIANYQYTQEELDAVNTVSAWDYDRLVTLSRWCASLGYITEDEAWEYIDQAAAMARADYSDWRAYFAAVLFGRTIWAEDGEFTKDDQDIAKQLLLDGDSVYNTAPFTGPNKMI